MATTAGDLIKSAMRLIGSVEPGESLTADEAADGLDMLNEMLESWSTESTSVYQILQENFPLVIGTKSYTIGTGGVFNTTRPLNILSAYIRTASTDSRLTIVTRDEYDRFVDKTTNAKSQFLYYESAFPLGTVYVQSPPDVAYTLFINSQKQLQQFTALTTAIALPPGYKRAVRYNLALEIAAEYNREPPPVVIKVAKESKDNIVQLNIRPDRLSKDIGNRPPGYKLTPLISGTSTARQPVFAE